MECKRIPHRDAQRVDAQQAAEGFGDAPQLHAGEPLQPQEGAAVRINSGNCTCSANICLKVSGLHMKHEGVDHSLN